MNRWAVVILVVPLLLATGLRLWDRFLEPSLRLTFFDVGQGDSALLQLPGGGTWLVDGGSGRPGPEMGLRVVVPELQRRGILTVDHVVLTHPDLDHGGGLMAVLEHLRVGRLWVNGAFREEEGALGALSALARQRGVPVERVNGATEWADSGVRVRLTAPDGPLGPNDLSLALEVRALGCAAFLGGDLEGPGEEHLMQKGRASAVDVLKVGHHGSRTSTGERWLRAFNPLIAVVSSGRGNPYGHPHGVVVERLRGRGVQVLRTDFHGGVRIRFERGRFTCHSPLGPCGEGNCYPNSN